MSDEKEGKLSFFINFLAKKWSFLTIFGTKTKKIKKNLKILCKKIEFGCKFCSFARIIIGKVRKIFKNDIDIKTDLGYNLSNKNKKR